MLFPANSTHIHSTVFTDVRSCLSLIAVTHGVQQQSAITLMPLLSRYLFSMTAILWWNRSPCPSPTSPRFNGKNRDVCAENESWGICGTHVDGATLPEALQLYVCVSLRWLPRKLAQVFFKATHALISSFKRFSIKLIIFHQFTNQRTNKDAFFKFGVANLGKYFLQVGKTCTSLVERFDKILSEPVWCEEMEG